MAMRNSESDNNRASSQWESYDCVFTIDRAVSMKAETSVLDAAVVSMHLMLRV